MLSGINHAFKTYTLEHTHGKDTYYSSLGFEYAYEQARKVWAWLLANSATGDIPEPSRDNIGTIQGYQEYSALMDAGRAYNERTRKRCNAGLIPELVKYEGERVEVVDCYGDTRRFIVGKSSGWMPCHLEIARRDSTGGPAVYGAPFRSVKIVRQK